ncbi:multiple resistance and pH regulation protein F (plasmid) [Ketogulonicigenium robustum]|uniref:Multiple resistance and pH regulation protein F n=1 Tax=Ketogulonicigenium robustum TaxID=92947 RepID=A0A1W6P3D1_9RHOB|nr:monovalent cation/H+ antiporter complex subunit F [Ketogulonicigenium robustum]ARO15986.1 multiple resistance and pH regulation protein F [Ketogulonicigenium robustum]
MTPTSFMHGCLAIGLTCIAIALCLSFVRLAKGPTLVDRIVAIDMITTAVIAICGLYAVKAGSDAFLDIAVALALVSFISVLAFARYAEQVAHRGDPDA